MERGHCPKHKLRRYITFNPSYLLRVPENKKYSWEDLKMIKQKIIDLKLKIQ